MYVSKLSLVDFRSYAEVDLELRPGVSALIGANGQGKTNLVEAIGYAATLASHRVSSDQPLVRAGGKQAVVRCTVVRDERPSLLEIEINPGAANRARVNRAPVGRVRDLLGSLRTVLFAPEDLALVKGDPAGRRRFVDELLVALAPRFSVVRSDYERVLRQRNTLLRQNAGKRSRRRGPDPLDGDGQSASIESTLQVWDEQLAALGGELIAARLYALRKLRPHVVTAYSEVSDAPGLARIGYQASLSQTLGELFDDSGREVPGRSEVAAAMAQRLTQLRAQELERGTTLVGPHLDDVTLGIGDLPAKGYASHGESWSLALALRLACYRLLRDEGPGSTSSREPVLILDDVFAELDAGRRSRLAGLVADAEQVLITAAVGDDVPRELVADTVNVREGRAER